MWSPFQRKKSYEQEFEDAVIQELFKNPKGAQWVFSMNKKDKIILASMMHLKSVTDEAESNPGNLDHRNTVGVASLIAQEEDEYLASVEEEATDPTLRDLITYRRKELWAEEGAIGKVIKVANNKYSGGDRQKTKGAPNNSEVLAEKLKKQIKCFADEAGILLKEYVAISKETFPGGLLSFLKRKIDLNETHSLLERLTGLHKEAETYYRNNKEVLTMEQRDYFDTLMDFTQALVETVELLEKNQVVLTGTRPLDVSQAKQLSTCYNESVNKYSEIGKTLLKKAHVIYP